MVLSQIAEITYATSMKTSFFHSSNIVHRVDSIKESAVKCSVFSIRLFIPSGSLSMNEIDHLGICHASIFSFAFNTILSTLNNCYENSADITFVTP